MRKLLEKNNWSQVLGMPCQRSYDEQQNPFWRDYMQLYYRFGIRRNSENCKLYYNSESMDSRTEHGKLEKLLSQEREKLDFLKLFFKNKLSVPNSMEE